MRARFSGWRHWCKRGEYRRQGHVFATVLASTLILTSCGRTPANVTFPEPFTVTEAWTQIGRSATHADWRANGPVAALQGLWRFGTEKERTFVGGVPYLPTKQAPELLDIVALNDRIFAASAFKIYGLSTNGKLLWRFAPPHRGKVSNLVALSDAVLSASVDDKDRLVRVLGLDPSTGRTLWSWWSRVESADEAWIAAADGRVLVTANSLRGSNAWLLNSSGKPVWSITVSGKPVGVPALSSTIAVVPTSRGVTAFDASNGVLRWTRAGGAPRLGPPVILNDRVIVGDGGDVSQGTEISGPETIRQYGEDGRILSSALDIRSMLRFYVAAQELFVFDSGREDSISIYDIRSGALRGRIALPNVTITSLVPVGDSVLVGGAIPASTKPYSATVPILELVDRAGNVAWSLRLAREEGEPSSDPTRMIALGSAVLLSTEDGVVMALVPRKG